MVQAAVSRDEWLTQRRKLLEREKALTRLRDEVSAERRSMPWVRIDESYEFEGPEGPVTIAELFEGRSQLIIKHFMLAPGETQFCIGCSLEADGVQGALIHLQNHDVTYVAVARAPIDEIEAFKARMGWQFPFLSSFKSDFNYDFNVSFSEEDVAQGNDVFFNYRIGPVGTTDLSGRSVFFKGSDGIVYHTYSAFARGNEEVLPVYAYLDLTPKGRNELGPHHTLADWVHLHDEYPRADDSSASSSPPVCCSNAER